MKSDVITHTDEENVPNDDVIDHKIAETLDTTVWMKIFICLLVVFFRKQNLRHLNQN
jgi:hypothetical protein